MWNFFNVKNGASKSPLSAGVIAILFFICLYVKIILFQSALFSIDDILQVLYFSKVVPALLFSSLVLIAKRKKWTIVLLVLVDIWAISNIIYFKANGDLLNVETILMAGNMNGFWSSIITYVDSSILAYIGITVLYAVLTIHFGCSSERKFKPFLVCIFLTAIFQFLDLEYRREIAIFHSAGRQKQIIEKYGNYSVFFRDVKYIASVTGGQGINDYVKKNTIVHYFPAQFVFYRYSKINLDANVEFTSADSLLIQSCINVPCEKPKASENLILILVESLESWAIEFADKNGNLVAPTLNSLAKNASLYCDKCKSQARRGTSGDGQLTINTGILPTQSNAACMVYGNNTYPNIAQYFESSFTVNPCPGVWNQTVVNPHYGYSKLIEKQTNDALNDNDVFDMAINTLDTCKTPTCMQILTISMHVPFNKVKSKDYLDFYEDIPNDLKKYLHCLHYTDSCLNLFLQRIGENPKYCNSTIVITGDHNIFKPNILQLYKGVIEKYSLSIPTQYSYCPLIICSPNMNDRILRNDICYQMDIFPTIMHSMNLDGTCWKGFGINLLDKDAERSITEDSAYYISNKIIVSNYFGNAPVCD